MPDTLYYNTTDNIKIAYDITGKGSLLILLHGIGKTRLDWHKAGYVARLKGNFTVLTIDVRGFGESDYTADYGIAAICDDINGIAYASGFDKYSVIGYSFGGLIARYLGALSGNSIESLVMIGAPFGPAVDEEFDKYITNFKAKYGKTAPDVIIKKPAASNSKIKNQISGYVTCFESMRKWQDVDYNRIKCPALLLFGSKNKSMANWYKHNPDINNQDNIKIHMLDNLNHPQEFSQIDTAFPVIDSFLRLLF